ncbi:hypothetical protein D7252_04535 [Microbacterium sp. CGR2]|nr:hypothetical protein D7252_04535 [Microbacterium sp. CGR2]
MLKIGLGAAIAGAAFAGMVAVPASAADTDQVVGKFTLESRSQAAGGFYPILEPSGAGPAMSAPTRYATAAEADAVAGEFLFPAIGAVGPIQPTSNPDLCLTYGNRLTNWEACDGGVDQQFQITTKDGRDYIYNQVDSYVISTSTANAQLSSGDRAFASSLSGASAFVPVEDAAPTDITGATVQDNTATAINGTGEPGSTITVSDANGVIGTTTVDEDGNWSVPSNITENTTVTATDGLTEDSFDIVFADAPIIAAPIALGALALGGVGFGGVMLRRRQKAGANA